MNHLSHSHPHLTSRFHLTTPHARAPEHITSPVDRYILDAELPLVGNNSVLGRSIVIHKVNGDRWVCATIPNRLKVRFPPVGGAPSRA